MSYERVERRLTAILAADVAGYSRLTGLDEEGTHGRLLGHLRSLVDPKIAWMPWMIIAAMSTAEGADPGTPSASMGIMCPGIEDMSPVSAAISPTVRQ